ncbi:MAG: aldolase/citrate lyase family protein [Bryobacteraceae bacterium]|nr:aldolase/citrate lyase family protein [Bryobacteraceae bacterium]
MSAQPVHVLYGGAHLFRPGLARRAGEIALAALDAHGYPLPLALGVEERLREKLRRHPVEDFRIDFEDGYGKRSEADEDAHARAAVAMLEAEPPAHRIGIRLKPFDLATETRAMRTLEIFLAAPLPAGFVVTLPKIATPDPVWRLARALHGHEIGIELLIETSQAVRRIDQLVDACEGKCAGLHFGAYDYMASLGVPEPAQSLLHPICDQARIAMLQAGAALGIPVADGVTNLLPVGETRQVHAGWKAHAEGVRHALDFGIYAGWDVHPAQLASRYATVFGYFRERLPEVSARLKNYADRATRLGNQFDDEATVRGLRAFADRAVECGAASREEVEI